jgi:hypothetical protein
LGYGRFASQPDLPTVYGRFSSRPYFSWDTADLLLSLIFPWDMADLLLSLIFPGIRAIGVPVSQYIVVKTLKKKQRSD